MRLNSYLLTERRSEPLKDEEALQLLKTKFSTAAKSSNDMHKRIYRGIHGDSGTFAMVKPSEHIRMSANTLNAYTLLIDNLPEWKEYPKRSRSIICSSDYSRATSYSGGGPTYVVFPENGAKIGVCTDFDIWTSFSKLKVSDMSAFNNELRNLIMVAYNTNDVYVEEFKEWKTFSESMNYIDKHKIEVYRNDPMAMDSIIRSLELDRYFKNKSMKLVDHLGWLLDPNRHGFELKKIGDDLPSSVEVWTDADCILIKSRHFMDNLVGKL